MFVGRLWAGSPETSAPSMLIAPVVGSSKPAIIRRVVVLPHPDGPSMVKNSPSPISRSISLTATKSPNAFDTPCRCTLASFKPTSLLIRQPCAHSDAAQAKSLAAQMQPSKRQNV